MALVLRITYHSNVWRSDALAAERTQAARAAVKAAGDGDLMRRFVAVLIAMAWLVLPVAGQSADSDILSKEDARQLLAMSKRQWEENIRGAVASGMATRVPGTPVGMKVMAPGAPVTTRLDYSRGDAKPAAVYVLVEFPAGGAPPLTPSMDKEMLAETQKQMTPEYDVAGRVERLSEDRMTFYFVITERLRR